MEYYLPILAVFSAAYIITNKEHNKSVSRLFILSTLAISAYFVFSMRWETGSDWFPYFSCFKYHTHRYFEKGFLAIVDLIRFFTDKYTLFLLSINLFFFLNFIIPYYYSRNFFISSLYIYTTLFSGFMGGLRAAVALSISNTALFLFLKKRYCTSFIVAIVSTLMHSAGILTFLIFFWLKSRLKHKILIISFMIVIAIFLIKGWEFLPKNVIFFKKLYSYKGLRGVVIHSPLRDNILISERLILLAIGIYALKKSWLADHEKSLVSISLLGTFWFLIFVKVARTVAGRGLGFFRMGDAILVSLIPYIFSQRSENQKNKYEYFFWYLLVLIYILGRFTLFLSGRNTYYFPYQIIFNGF